VKKPVTSEKKITNLEILETMSLMILGKEAKYLPVKNGKMGGQKGGLTYDELEKKHGELVRKIDENKEILKKQEKEEEEKERKKKTILKILPQDISVEDFFESVITSKLAEFNKSINLDGIKFVRETLETLYEIKTESKRLKEISIEEILCERLKNYKTETTLALKIQKENYAIPYDEECKDIIHKITNSKKINFIGTKMGIDVKNPEIVNLLKEYNPLFKTMEHNMNNPNNKNSLEQFEHFLHKYEDGYNPSLTGGVSRESLIKELEESPIITKIIENEISEITKPYAGEINTSLQIAADILYDTIMECNKFNEELKSYNETQGLLSQKNDLELGIELINNLIITEKNNISIMRQEIANNETQTTNRNQSTAKSFRNVIVFIVFVFILFLFYAAYLNESKTVVGKVIDMGAEATGTKAYGQLIAVIGILGSVSGLLYLIQPAILNTGLVVAPVINNAYDKLPSLPSVNSIISKTKNIYNVISTTTSNIPSIKTIQSNIPSIKTIQSKISDEGEKIIVEVKNSIDEILGTSYSEVIEQFFDDDNDNNNDIFKQTVTNWNEWKKETEENKKAIIERDNKIKRQQEEEDAKQEAEENEKMQKIFKNISNISSKDVLVTMYSTFKKKMKDGRDINGMEQIILEYENEIANIRVLLERANKDTELSNPQHREEYKMRVDTIREIINAVNNGGSLKEKIGGGKPEIKKNYIVYIYGKLGYIKKNIKNSNISSEYNDLIRMAIILDKIENYNKTPIDLSDIIYLMNIMVTSIESLSQNNMFRAKGGNNMRNLTKKSKNKRSYKKKVFRRRSRKIEK
jgi:hypothetical protein